MITSDEQLTAVYAEFGEPSDSWADSLSLEPLLCAAHEHGVLQPVWVFQILDDDRDLFLVSVELRPQVYAHAAPTSWNDIRPEPGMAARDAVRHVLECLRDIAIQVIEVHAAAGL